MQTILRDQRIPDCLGAQKDSSVNLTSDSVTTESLSSEPCHCGAAVRVHYGPDIRFNPPCDKPRMYRAECSGHCINPSFTCFTPEQALERWNERMRKTRATGSQQ
jgi:hypothetical protein